jgi:glycine cleavage system H protein
MSEIPQDLYYTKEHEYLKETPEGGVYVVGITAYAQGELGDVVYVELPSAGDSFDRMETFGTIEAVKAVSDLYCPIRGTVVEVNSKLDDDPALVNSDPYGAGWMIRLRIEDEAELDALLDADGYRRHVGELLRGAAAAVPFLTSEKRRRCPSAQVPPQAFPTATSDPGRKSVGRCWTPWASRRSSASPRRPCPAASDCGGRCRSPGAWRRSVC